MNRRVCFVAAALLLSVNAVVSEPALPQQGWYVELAWEVPDNPLLNISLGTDAAGRVYLYSAGSGFGVRIYDSTGTWLNPAPDNTSQVPKIAPNISAETMAVNPFGDPATDRIIVFGGSSPGASIELCLAVPFDPGVNDNGCTSASGPVTSIPDPVPQFFDALVVASDGSIFASSTVSDDIRLYGSDLSFVRIIGEAGSAGLPGTLKNPVSLAVTDSGNLLVRDWYEVSATKLIHEFKPTGAFVRQLPYRSSISGRHGMAAGFGEIVIGIRPQDIGQSEPIPVHPPFGRVAHILDDSDGSQTGVLAASGWDAILSLVFDGPDILYAAARVAEKLVIAKYRRTFRTYNPNLNGPPAPAVLSTAARPGTTLLDVEFIIHDSGMGSIDVAALALKDGAKDLNSVRLIQAFDTGSGQVTLPQTLSSNTQHRFTWDAGADLLDEGVDFIDARIRVLASDRLGLTDLHFITIPAGAPVNCANLTINVSPLTDDDFLNAWLWLLANFDSDLDFNAGSITGSATAPVAYRSMVLASGITTTTLGRQYLFEQRLAVREATAMEVDCVKEAVTPGFVNQFAPVTRFGNHPELVNEFGFDTGDSVTGVWVVLTP